MAINLAITAVLGDFLADVNPTTIVLPAENLNVPVSVAIEDDAVFEADGLIQVRIEPGNNYEIAQDPNHTASVTVFDDDTPSGFSIQAVGDSVNEGETAVFQVFNNSQSQQSVAVSVSISQRGEFITNSPFSEIINVSADSRVAEFEIEIPDDLVWEHDGTLIATLVWSDEYTVATVPANTASIQILDNDQPSGVAIRAPLESNITEGETIQVEILTNRPVAFSRQINLAITESGGNFITNSVNLSPTVELPAHQSQVTFQVNTEDDYIVEEDGQVQIVVLPGRGYRVASGSANSAEILIVDNDDQPEIAIQPLFDDAIFEGEEAQFLVSANRLTATDIVVNLVVTEHNSNFISSTVQSDVEVPIVSGQLRTLIVVPTESDLIDEPNGEIFVELVNGQNYGIAAAPNNVASIAVLDNDEQPIIAIQSVVDSIYEDSSAEFVITSPTAPSVDLVVDVVLTKTGNFFDNIPDESVILGAGSFETSIVVQIDDDENAELEVGKVIAVINPSTDYQVANTPNNKAEVLVLDNDIASEISITSRNDNPIVEGVSAEFQLVANPIPATDLAIALILEISGGIENQITSTEFTETIPGGQSRLDFTIPTSVNNIDESTKVIKVILKPAQTNTLYQLGTEHTVQVAVLDNELPELTISGGADITEGNSAQFVISADIARETDLTIHYQVSDGDNNFLIPEQLTSDSIILDSGNSSVQAELLIPTFLDSTDEADGLVTVALQNDTNPTLQRIGFLIL